MIHQSVGMNCCIKGYKLFQELKIFIGGKKGSTREGVSSGLPYNVFKMQEKINRLIDGWQYRQKT